MAQGLSIAPTTNRLRHRSCFRGQGKDISFRAPQWRHTIAPACSLAPSALSWLEELSAQTPSQQEGHRQVGFIAQWRHRGQRQGALACSAQWHERQKGHTDSTQRKCGQQVGWVTPSHHGDACAALAELGPSMRQATANQWTPPTAPLLVGTPRSWAVLTTMIFTTPR